MLICNKKNYIRHKILLCLWNKYEKFHARSNSAFDTSMNVNELKKIIWFASKNEIFAQAVYLETTKDVDKIIDTYKKPALYHINAIGIQNLQDNTYLKLGRRSIFKNNISKELISIISGAIGLFLRELFETIRLVLKNHL